VNDGVCDCCDGSDEHDGSKQCSHSCAAGNSAGAVDIEQLQLGAQARMGYVSDARATAATGCGLDGAYHGLQTTCLEIKSGVFTYEICPFAHATQKEPQKSTEIALGQWDSSASFTADRPHEMKFSGGALCGEKGKPDSVERSVTVAVQCGASNEIISEAEISMCQYTMVMHSPAACDAAALAEHNLDPQGIPFTSTSGDALAEEPDEIVYHDEL
jgi:hypothetical protein